MRSVQMSTLSISNSIPCRRSDRDESRASESWDSSLTPILRTALKHGQHLPARERTAWSEKIEATCADLGVIDGTTFIRGSRDQRQGEFARLATVWLCGRRRGDRERSCAWRGTGCI